MPLGQLLRRGLGKNQPGVDTGVDPGYVGKIICPICFGDAFVSPRETDGSSWGENDLGFPAEIVVTRTQIIR